MVVTQTGIEIIKSNWRKPSGVEPDGSGIGSSAGICTGGTTSSQSTSSVNTQIAEAKAAMQAKNYEKAAAAGDAKAKAVMEKLRQDALYHR